MIRTGIRIDQKVKRKSIHWWIGFLIPAVVVSGIAVLFLAIQPDETASMHQDSYVLQINGLPVIEQEFRLYMDKERGAVTNYFSVTYQAEDSPDYWMTEFGGERPIDMLKKRAADAATKGKLLQELAWKQGLIEDTSFEQIVVDWKRNNAEREKSMKSNKTIFGLGTYDLSQYYFYYLSQLSLKLEEALGKSELQVTEADLKQSYDSHAADYQDQTRLTIEELSIPYTEEDKQQSRETIFAAKATLDKGALFDETSQRYGKTEPRRLDILTTNHDTPLDANAWMKRAAASLAIGSSSGVLDTGSGYSIIHLVDKVEHESVQLESLKTQLTAETLRRKFEAYMEDQAKQCDVVMFEENFQRLHVFKSA